MNLYTMVGSGVGSAEAAALSTRLAAWHDAMVAHERKIRGGRTGELCDEECPHAEARALWNEALDTFGVRAHDLTFLRTRAMIGSALSGRSVVSTSRQPARHRELDDAAESGRPRAFTGNDRAGRAARARRLAGDATSADAAR